MIMSEAEISATKYASRDREFIATTGLFTKVEALPLKSGKWRAYLTEFVTPWSPRGQGAESKEVVRDDYGYIITESTQEQLVARLREIYPGWKWG